MASTIASAARKVIPGQAQEDTAQKPSSVSTSSAFGVEDMFKQIMDVVQKSVSQRTESQYNHEPIVSGTFIRTQRLRNFVKSARNSGRQIILWNARCGTECSSSR